MILIAHRGNLYGPNSANENKPSYIDDALNQSYNVEIDVWFENKTWYLGHDCPIYKINKSWIDKRKKYLWLHTKNIDAFLNFGRTRYNYFWHETDTITLTSKKYIWAYPGKQKIKNSIAVMPEINDDDISECLGICTDYVKDYEKTIINISKRNLYHA